MARIRKGARTHLYIEEHMRAKGLSFDILAGRLGVARQTVYRWSKEQWRLDPGKMEALRDALDLEHVTDLFRVPSSRPSVDAHLAGVPDDDFQMILDLAKRLSQRRAS